MKKVFLTGGSGFLGKNIKEQLKDKYEIYAPSSAELDLLSEIDLSKYLENKNFDVVIHAANKGGLRGNKVEGVLHDNLRMFFNIIRAKSLYGKLIVFGSGAEYDKRNQVADVKEEDFDLTVPVDEYGFSKYVMAKYAMNNDYITHLRFFGVYGKYEDFCTRFISNMICLALYDKPLKINQNVYFDYIYVNDAIKILEHTVERDMNFRCYNIGRGEKIDLLSLAQIVLRVMQKDLPIHIVNDGFGNEYSCNVSRLKEEIPDVVLTNFDESIGQMVDYYKSNKDKVNLELI